MYAAYYYSHIDMFCKMWSEQITVDRRRATGSLSWW